MSAAEYWRGANPRGPDRAALGLLVAMLLLIFACPCSALSQEPAQERVEAEDTDGDGKPDQWKVFQGDLLVRMERDRDQNGKPEVWVHYERYTIPPKEGEEGGQPRTSSRPSRSEVDRDGNGTPDIVRFMKEGRPEREQADLNLDGKPDAWAYYKEGVKEFMIMDKNHDGRPDAWFYYGQGGGKLEAGRMDEDFDGTPDRVIGNPPAEETRRPW
ncbi:MAG: hypothetical protein HYZ94_02000 [Candidatus Omnitrophica bacterium]|nr:hypothetical protein [Candidatus Omnitrophota bacterium]